MWSEAKKNKIRTVFVSKRKGERKGDFEILRSPLSSMAEGVISTDDQGDPPVPMIQKTWATVTKGKKTLKKYDLEIFESDGAQSVQVPLAVVEEANLLWDDFVVARFLETAPHVAKVHMILSKIWMFGEKSMKIDVYPMDSVTMRIRVPSTVVREKIIRRGVWNIAGVPMVVSKWSPVEGESEKKLTPLWVHLKKVPMSMYSWEGLSFIASAAGQPDKLHPETIACTNFEVAKICVKADLSKKLPRMINFKIQGIDTMIEYTYPWLPSKCNVCGKWGHKEKVCSLNKTEEVQQQEEEGLIEKDTQNKEKEVDKTERMNPTIVTEEEEVAKGNKEEMQELWKKVYGEKTGRSPMKSQEIQFGQIRIVTPSRFAALSLLEDEKEEEIDEINKEVQIEASTEEGEIINDPKEVEKKNDQIGEAVNTREIEVVGGRPILPRNSKTRHKVLSDTSNQVKSNLGTAKVPRKN